MIRRYSRSKNIQELIFAVDIGDIGRFAAYVYIGKRLSRTRRLAVLFHVVIISLQFGKV